MRKNCLLLLFLLCSSFNAVSQNTSAKLVKAQTFMDEERYSEADQLFDEMLEVTPNKLDILYNAAFCKLYVGRPDIAIKYLQRFLDKNNDDAGGHNLLGLAYERLGNNDDAMEHYSLSIKLERNFFEAYFNRGRRYLAMDSIVLAKKDFNYAKKNKIIIPELYLLSGNLYSQLKQYDSALIDLSKIEKYKTNDPFYFAILGDAYFVTAGNDTLKLEKALECYTKCLRLDSENVNVLRNRSIVYDKLDLTEKGELDKEKIFEIQKKNGVDITSIKYRRVNSADNIFSIEIPEEWRVLVSQNNDSDIVIFFDTNFNNVYHNAIYAYDFGGQLKYYPNYFEPHENTLVSLSKREEKFSEFTEKRKKFCDSVLKNYNETFKKSFNPNDKMLRGLSKYTFFTSNGNKFCGIQYFCITTTGKLIDIIFWLPAGDFFHYELLFDYIYESLIIN